ncbi:MAG: ABC transporter permease [Clostridia bacterium]|nr:ABC transporter permease [Clostridia bacterium]
MKILNKIALKNLKLNKKRTTSTIIGIVLSVALICAVATMANSFRGTLVQNAINETGYYHIELIGINRENLADIKNNRDIKEIKIMYDKGYSYFNGGKEEDTPYIHIYSMNSKNLEELAYEIIEGRQPQNENEIVLNKSALFNSDYKIGDTIDLEIGTRKTLDDYELENNNPSHKSIEKLVNTVKKTYKIVGMVNKVGTSYLYYGITTNEEANKIDAYCSLKNPQEYKETIPKLLGVKDYNAINTLEEYEKAKYDYALNYELLRWEVFAISDTTISMLYSVVAVVIAIILFTSVFCIRNSFAISTLEKTKIYGMFASVGATKKQIKKSVLFEAMLLGIIGIPLGILSGIFAVFILLQIVNSVLGNALLAHVKGIVFEVNVLSIIISVILGGITIYLSASGCAKRASRVSPIEQLRNTNDIKKNSKKLKVPKIISKIFKTGGKLAYKNLKRSKKKYRTTVISIALSIFIFITTNSFVTSAFNLSKQYYLMYDYNIRASGGEIRNMNEQDTQKIRTIDGVEEAYFLYDNAEQQMIRIKELSKVNLKPIEDYLLTEDIINENGIGVLDSKSDKYMGLEIRALDDDSFKKYAKKIGADYEKIKTTGILCDNYEEVEENGTIKTMRTYNYKEGETITGNYEDKEISIKVGKVTDIRPYGMEGYHWAGGYLIVNEKEYKNLDLKLQTITIQSGEKVEEVVKTVSDLYNSLNILNLKEENQKQNGMVLVINIFLYGFITVITLIGVTNIFNTITSNIELRQKEFAMLKSIGMTKKEFNRMVNLETIFYGTKALLYGVILGLLGTFAIYKAFSIKMSSGIYIPIGPIIISAIFVFVIVFVIMKYSISKINKQNIIETIRKENV